MLMLIARPSRKEPDAKVTNQAESQSGKGASDGRGLTPDIEHKLRADRLGKNSHLRMKMEWVGVAHYNTDNPHVHLIIRSKDERGAIW